MAIERIGFFHFGANHTDPIGSLKGAIADAGSVRNSLIVLPEGFNIGKFYKETERGCHYDLAILSDLHQLAKACAATFVAGLILKVSDNPDPPYSAAYIIDGTFEERLCYKMSDDSSGNYTPCRSDPGISNPLPHSNACVGGLICADILVLDGSAHERVRLLFERMNEFKSDLETIVCIPACMHRPDLDGEEGSSVFCYENWKGRRYILANTTAKGWNGTRSFITDRDDKKTHTFPDSVGDNQYINKICLAKL